MRKRYVIVSQNEKGGKLYFLYNYACFSIKSGYPFTTKKKAHEALQYAKKCAGNQVIIDNLKVEEV